MRRTSRVRDRHQKGASKRGTEERKRNMGGREDEEECRLNEKALYSLSLSPVSIFSSLLSLAAVGKKSGHIPARDVEFQRYLSPPSDNIARRRVPPLLFFILSRELGSPRLGHAALSLLRLVSSFVLILLGIQAQVPASK